MFAALITIAVYHRVIPTMSVADTCVNIRLWSGDSHKKLIFFLPQEPTFFSRGTTGNFCGNLKLPQKCPSILVFLLKNRC